MRRPLILALATATTLLSAGAAHAGHVNWSIGITLPPIATVISNGPAYAPAPVYYEPAPVYYQPAPVYYQPAPVIYAPPPVVYRPAPQVVYVPPPVVYGRPVPIVYGGWSQRPQHWQHPHYQHRDSDRDGIPDRWDRYDNRQRWDREHDGRKVPHQASRDEYGDRRR